MIFAPLAAAAGALTDAAEDASYRAEDRVGYGTTIAELGGFALVCGEHVPIGFCPVIGHFVDVVGGGSNAAGATGIDMLTVDGVRRSQKNRSAAQALAVKLGGAPGASFISRTGPLVDNSGRAALVRLYPTRCHHRPLCCDFRGLFCRIDKGDVTGCLKRLADLFEHRSFTDMHEAQPFVSGEGA